MSIFKKEEQNILPAPFQRGTEEQKSTQDFLETGSLVAGFFLLVAQGFNALCNINDDYRKRNR